MLVRGIVSLVCSRLHYSASADCVSGSNGQYNCLRLSSLSVFILQLYEQIVKKIQKYFPGSKATCKSQTHAFSLRIHLEEQYRVFI